MFATVGEHQHVTPVDVHIYKNILVARSFDFLTPMAIDNLAHKCNNHNKRLIWPSCVKYKFFLTYMDTNKYIDFFVKIVVVYHVILTDSLLIVCWHFIVPILDGIVICYTKTKCSYLNEQFYIAILSHGRTTSACVESKICSLCT